MYIPTFDDVKEAQKRISPYIHKTPVLTSSFMNELSGAELFFKCENFQKAGVFKVRGASNAVFGLSEEKAVKGVATHSSGNHALSLAYAAGRRGIPVTVVMPNTALEAKKAAVYGYGGSIVECEPSTSSREETIAKVVAESGADFVHPYNDPRVISGQATCSLELLEQVGKLDSVVAPIGGGGMVSGTCLALSNVSPETKITTAALKKALAESDHPTEIAEDLAELHDPQKILKLRQHQGSPSPEQTSLQIEELSAELNSLFAPLVDLQNNIIAAQENCQNYGV